MRPRQTVEKRRKEALRHERKQEKADQRKRRKEERASRPERSEEQVDPDIAHIVWGPQPIDDDPGDALAPRRESASSTRDDNAPPAVKGNRGNTPVAG